jgi:hypothetical protein
MKASSSFLKWMAQEVIKNKDALPRIQDFLNLFTE